MRQLVILATAIVLVIAACGGVGDETATTGAPPATTAPASTTGASNPTSAPATTAATGSVASTVAPPVTVAPADVHPLVIVAIDFAAGFVLIRNDGDTDYDLTGHWLCNRPTYQEMPAQTLAPGRIVEIDAASMNITADSGELGVYTSNDFSNASAIVRYVEWGEPSHGRSGTAIAAGLWADGDFVDNNGANIESSGANPVSSTDWSSN